MARIYEFKDFSKDCTSPEKESQIIFSGDKIVPPTTEEFVQSNWHEEIEIQYFREGEAVVECDHQVHAVQAGDIVIMNAYEPHSHAWIQGNARYDMLLFHPQVLSAECARESSRRLLLPLIEHRVRFVSIIHGDERIIRIFDALHSQQRGPVFHLHRYALVLELTALLLENYTQTIVTSADADYEQRYARRIFPAIDYIRRHYAQPIALDTLAASCSMAVSYFCPVFRRVTGMTAVQYINRYRTARAALLLRTTDLPIHQIAAQCGFQDVGYFHRCFRALQEQTPQEVRRSM